MFRATCMPRREPKMRAIVSSWKLRVVLTVLIVSLQWTSAQNAPPTIQSISPNVGPAGGGTQVTLRGTGFLPGATATVGGAAATNLVVLSDTTITATTPPGSGAVDVVVSNYDGQSSTLAAKLALFNNWGFEAGTANWKFTGTGTFTVRTNSSLAHSGNNYAELTSGVGQHA